MGSTSSSADMTSSGNPAYTPTDAGNNISGKYTLNGQAVSYNDYQAGLAKLGIQHNKPTLSNGMNIMGLGGTYSPLGTKDTGGTSGGSSGGGYAAPGVPEDPIFTPPPMPDPTNATGLKAITGGKTLGDIGANVFDKKAQGLKGLTTGTTERKGTTTIPSTKRKKLSELLGLNVGMLKPGSGLGVQV